MKSGNKSNYSKEDIRIARIAKAFGHPARIAILRNLASRETCSFGELSGELPLADSTVSQHLTGLKDAGLIKQSVDASRAGYSINFENWKIARKYIKEFMKIRIIKKTKKK